MHHSCLIHPLSVSATFDRESARNCRKVDLLEAAPTFNADSTAAPTGSCTFRRVASGGPGAGGGCAINDRKHDLAAMEANNGLPLNGGRGGGREEG